MSYAWEKFFSAVQGLASGQSGIRERLISAYNSNLIHVKPEELPEKIQNDFRETEEELTKVKAKGSEGDVAASVNAMSEDRASEIAQKIVGMFNTLAELE